MYSEQFAVMQHYIRTGFWRSAQVLAHQTMKQIGGPSVFTFWFAYTKEKEGDVAAAVKDYKASEKCSEVRLASLLAQMNVLKRAKMIDTDAVEDLETQIMTEDKDLQPSVLIQCALFCRVTGEYSKAREYVNKAIALQADFTDAYTSAQATRGWVDLLCGRAAFVDKSLVLFERALSSQANDLDSLLGKIAFHDKKAQYSQVIEVLNTAVVEHPSLHFLLTLKAQVQLKMDNWEQGVEIAQRVLGLDAKNIEGLAIVALYFLVKESKMTPSLSMLTDLLNAVDAIEPQNFRLYYTLSQAFSRLCAGNLQILGVTGTMIDRALKISPGNPMLYTELGYQSIFRADYKTATGHFEKGAQSEEGAAAPLLGAARCYIMLGKYDEAEKQLQFLNEIQNPLGKSAELLLLQAMVSWRKHRNSVSSVEFLSEAMAAVQAQVQTLVPGIEMYAQFNPQLLIDIAKELMQHTSSESKDHGNSSRIDPVAEKTHKALELLVRIVPGTVQGLLLQAQIAFLTGNYEKAHSAVVACIRQDNTCAEAHLLAAQIAFQQENYQVANSNLDQALCLDFKVREMPLYCYLKGTILSATRDYPEAITTLQRALEIMNQMKLGPGKQNALNVSQHTAVYVELAQVHMRVKNLDEAHRVVHEAANEMRGTPEEGRVTMVKAMLTARKDVDMALNILRSIPNSSPYFLKAKAQMANLFLTQHSNRREFAKCYEDLVEAYPSVSSYTFLGEAYLNIQEPERAIVALEKARSMDPNDAELAGKIGRALMITHDYQKGLRYYRDAVASDPQRWSLRHDLAALYSRLGDQDKAIGVLREGLDNMKQQTGIEDLHFSMDKVKTMMMLSHICKKVGDIKGVTESLVQARVFQNTVLNRMRGETSETIYKQRTIAANICYDLGQFYVEQGQAEKALSLFNEALKFEETHDKSMLALAGLYLERGELEGSEQQCHALLRVVPSSEEAMIMLADIMFRKSKFDDAAFHYQALLEKSSSNYDALVKYVQLLRHCGKLSEAGTFFKNMDKAAATRQRQDPGLHFAKGLYYRYTNDPQNALKELHLGRNPRDNPYAERCVTNMIEIYLNPDNENIWEDHGEGEVKLDYVADNVRTAEKLLLEITDKKKKLILEAYVLIATKRKDNLERALSKFYEIISSEMGESSSLQDTVALEETQTKGRGGNKESASLAATANTEAASPTEKVNVACLVGLSTALQLLKMTPKARNHLKRVAKATYYSEDADHFERGWLMLADLYIQGGKYDLAQDLLKRALQANKSCSRAWEFMGLIYEKEQCYNDASECYECAWKLVNESDPGIGYKLAFNYLKARRNVQAINVCTKVLTTHPKYPKIRKDILDKARAGLRP